MSKKIIDQINIALNKSAENQLIEFKSAKGGLPKKTLWRSITAFFNSPGGGSIIFGVEESAGKITVVGLGNLEKFQQDLVSYITQKIIGYGDYKIEHLTIDGKDLISLIITELEVSKKPSYYKAIGMPRGACIRKGSSNKQITDEELKSFLRYSPQYQYDKKALKFLTLEDLDLNKIKTFLKNSAKRTGRKIQTSVNNKLLKNLFLVSEENNKIYPTLAGYMIFAQGDPQNTGDLSRYSVQCVRYAGTSVASPIIDKQEVFGTLDQQIDQSHKFILKNINLSARIVGAKRVEKYEYPEDALREAIVNALVHRDYIITGTYVQIAVFSNRIEISNPGILPPGVTISNLKESQFSRNEVIANILRSMDYVEEFGRGIDLIYSRMKDWGLIEPLFKNKSNMFKVVFLGKAFSDLNKRQINIWYFLQQNDQINFKQAKKLLPNVSKATIINDLKKMIENEMIEKKGASVNTFYIPKY